MKPPTCCKRCIPITGHPIWAPHPNTGTLHRVSWWGSHEEPKALRPACGYPKFHYPKEWFPYRTPPKRPHDDLPEDPAEWLASLGTE